MYFTVAPLLVVGTEPPVGASVSVIVWPCAAVLGSK